MFLNYQQAASFLEDVYHVAIPLDVMARLVEETEMEKYRPDCKYPSCDGQKQAFGMYGSSLFFGKSLVE